MSELGPFCENPDLPDTGQQAVVPGKSDERKESLFRQGSGGRRSPGDTSIKPLDSGR